MSNDTETAIIGVEDESLALQQIPEGDQVLTTMRAIEAFQQIVQDELHAGTDYSKAGLFGKNSKPSLLKPGGEKIMSILGCRPQYEILTEIEDFDKPLFYYKFRCTMVHIRTGQVWGDGIGSCNSQEKRYVWDRYKKQPRPFEFSDVNTIQKMAQKRAMIQAVLTLGRLSNLFTQDIEDYAGHPEQTQKTQTRKTQTRKKKAPESELNQEEKDKLKQWAEIYPSIKEELLTGKTPNTVTRDEYTEIRDRVMEIEKEFGDEDTINEDIPF